MAQNGGTHRRAAILGGLEFIYKTAIDPGNFIAYGYDYLFALHQVSVTSNDLVVRDIARQMGISCARRWRDALRSIGPASDADAVANAILGSLAADRLGFVDARMTSSLAELARRFTAEDFFWFNPAVEGPPRDVPADCTCGAGNLRGVRRCHVCGASVETMSRYEVFVVALIRTYVGERYGVALGASYSEVLKWVPALRPYRDARDDDWVWSLYAATHLVYTLNDYNTFSLRPEWLPAEFAFLRDCLAPMIEDDDPDAVGEILDSLKSFGLTNADPGIARGMDYLLSSQNPDGSWGDCEATDVYDRYHPTLAAINGLDDYLLQQEAPRFTELERLLAGTDVSLSR